MIQVNVLTNNSCPNSKAFNCPLLASRRFLEAKGIEARFHFSISPNIFNSDLIFINSNFFRPFWRDKKKEILDFLENARKRNLKTIWFDTTDSTWCTQFEVLPFVNRFLKAQILHDKNLYLNPFRTGRIYTDYFDSLYASGEKTESYPAPSAQDLGKIGISWNSCFENYTERRFSQCSRIRQFLRPLTANFAKENIRVEFQRPDCERTVGISCRIGTSHSRPSVAAHRRAIMKKLQRLNVRCEKLTLPGYFSELRNSQVAASPFGVGEITLRDFEIIICGAAMLKPDMAHLRTWPELYQPGKTFVAHKWDLSDFDEKIDFLLENPEKRLEIAENAGKIYSHHLSDAGMMEFADRLVDIVKKM